MWQVKSPQLYKNNLEIRIKTVNGNLPLTVFIVFMLYQRDIPAGISAPTRHNRFLM
jgi:hypothetical protein